MFLFYLCLFGFCRKIISVRYEIITHLFCHPSPLTILTLLNIIQYVVLKGLARDHHCSRLLNPALNLHCSQYHFLLRNHHSNLSVRRARNHLGSQVANRRLNQ